MNRVQWAPSADAEHYVIMRGVSSSSSFSEVATVTASVPGASYDEEQACMYWLDASGSSADWYEVASIDSYGTTGSFSEPFQTNSSFVVALTTVARLKEYLGITQTADDALLARLVAASSRWFVNQVGQGIGQTVYYETFSGDGGRFYQPDQAPVNSVLSLTVDGSGVLPRTDPTGSGYVSNRTSIYLSDDLAFSRGTQNCAIVYQAGYSPVPEDVEQAVLEHAALAYRSRTRIGVMSNSVSGESVSYQTTTVPFSVQSVVDQWRRNIV